eukprot:TRINITY_DN114277_c0_g1_i1.p1 TRINITY_DN114277_c0_g1~~TRINITY_DN114277_c0_g1_i1.p1  ORF type:complete len:325 (+),score=32.16 TRINITY_DN114277_c0_g1_i1:127-1101(+)
MAAAPGAEMSWSQGAFCAVSTDSCNAVWFCPFPTWCVKTAFGVTSFLSLFYGLAFLVYPRIEGVLKTKLPSKFPDEESRYWFAWHIVSITHATLVCYMSMGPVMRLTGASNNILMTTPHSSEAEFAIPDLASCANGAHIFKCFLLYDLVVISLYKLAKWDMLLHHVVFFLFSMLVFYNCFLGYIAGWLLLMEFSTIPLNYVSFFRNRLGYDHWSVSLAFGTFAVSFCYIRLFSLAVHVLRPFFESLYDPAVRYDLSGVGGVPKWQLVVVSVGLVMAFGLQASWALGAILPKLRKIFLGDSQDGSKRNGDSRASSKNGVQSKKEM